MKYTKIFFLIFYGFFGYLSLMGMQKNQPIVVEIENVFFQSEIENEKDNYIRSPLVYGSENSISFLPRVENPCLLLLEGKDNFTKLLNKINTNEDQKIIFLQF